MADLTSALEGAPEASLESAEAVVDRGSPRGQQSRRPSERLSAKVQKQKVA